ncbi:MAG: hypothetical protein MUC50_05650 [Myxococcota bacterium]|nr:hypothetical protein [Myxococcota bacterium]
MSFDLIKANLNLYAILKNLEDLVVYDAETKEAARDWAVSVQFSVKGGPKAYVAFRDGKCEVGRGKCSRPSARLYFVSPRHLNKMFEGQANPIPLKGLTKLRFLTRDFPKATEKLEYYLKPTAELLNDPSYMALNTRFTLTTAAYALRELFEYDPIGRLNATHIANGTVMLKVLPSGPSAHLKFEDGKISVHKGDTKDPTALMTFKNLEVANALLNGKSDAFAAVASGDVAMKGRVPAIEAINIVLDRIPLYLS